MDEIENIDVKSSDDADRLLESISAPADSGNANSDGKATAALEEFELSVGGKQIKAKRDEVLKWAQMGYDAPNRIGTLSKEVESYRTKVGEIQRQEQKIAEWNQKYGEVDAYFTKNPQFRDHVLQTWQNRQTQSDPSNPLIGRISELEQKLSQVSQFAETVQERELRERIQKEDSALVEQINTIKKDFPNVDLASVDSAGRSLEYRVLEYAKNNGIRSFTTAFRDFYHDELKKNYEAAGREAVMKEKQQNTKLGVLGITRDSTRKNSKDSRSMSMDDIARDIIREHNLR